MLRFEPVQRLSLDTRPQPRRDLIDKLGEVARMLASKLVRSALLEPLQSELADGLEHEETPFVRLAQQALVDERLQRIELGATDGFRRLECEAAREDSQ